MLKRAKFLNIICSITISVIFVIMLILGLIFGGVISFETNKLIIRSGSEQKIYNGVPLTSDEWEIVSGELEEGHTIDVDFSGIQSYAGKSDNKFYVTIKDEFGLDVTSDYNLTIEYGTLEIIPKPLTVTSGNAGKIYDGRPLTCDEWSYSEGELLAGHSMKVDVIGEITDIGIAFNTIGAVAIYDGSGKDITYNYEILLSPGILTIANLDGMIDGSGILNLGGAIGGQMPGGASNVVCYRLYNEKTDKVYLKLKSFGDYNGRAWLDATPYYEFIGGQYSADYLTGSTAPESYSMLQIESLTGQYALPYYLRRTYSAGHEIQTSDVCYEGNTDSIYSMYYSKFDSSTAALPQALDMYERSYRDFVYSQYLELDDLETRRYMSEIISKEGFYGHDMKTILAVAEYIQNSAKYNMKYDTALDSEENVAVAFLSKYKEGICQHYASAATLLYRAMGIPARYTVGFSADTVAGTWVDVRASSAHAWVEVYLDGIGWVQVEVTGGDSGQGETKKITLTPVYADKVYDGMPLYAPQRATGFAEYEKLGYKLRVSVSGERTDVGKTKSKITDYVIYDPDGKPVTDRFDIKLSEGTIHVYLSEVIFSSYSAKKMYDGVPLTTDISTCRLVGGEFVHNDVKYSIGNGSSITTVGKKAADFSVRLTSEGTDVTDQYKITKRRGTLEVTPRDITVKANDAEKYYDGTPLYSDGYTVIEGGLAAGDSIVNCDILMERLCVEVGRSECIPENIVIHNSNGQDVTGSYSIKYKEGTLRVKPV